MTYRADIRPPLGAAASERDAVQGLFGLVVRSKRLLTAEGR
jgi:hypothetical protein